MTAQHTQDLTQGSITGHLVRLAVPLVFGNILQEFYNTIDAFVVGRFAGQEQFAAIGVAGTVMNLFFYLHRWAAAPAIPFCLPMPTARMIGKSSTAKRSRPLRPGFSARQF